MNASLTGARTTFLGESREASENGSATFMRSAAGEPLARWAETWSGEEMAGR